MDKRAIAEKLEKSILNRVRGVTYITSKFYYTRE